MDTLTKTLFPVPKENRLPLRVQYRWQRLDLGEELVGVGPVPQEIQRLWGEALLSPFSSRRALRLRPRWEDFPPLSKTQDSLCSWGVPCVMAERKRQVESQKLEVCAPKGLQELEQTGQPVPTMETHWITERNCKT